MYSVLLIDDEPMIREGLKQVIEWESYGFKICDQGIDGRDGLNKIRMYQPDVVLVDIRMPGMSGIELIEQAKQEGYTCKFIILSGYSSFSYAKQSIKLGIESYLLKPIDEEELITLLNEIKITLENERKIHFQLTQYEQLSEEQRWKALIEGRLDDAQISNLVAKKVEHLHLAILTADKNMKSDEIKELLQPFETNELKLIWKDRSIYLLFMDSDEKQIKDYLKLFIQKIERYTNDPIQGYLAEGFQELEQIDLVLHQIDQLITLGYCYGNHAILTYAILEKEGIDQLDSCEE